MKIKINGEKLIAISEVLLILYLCLPITLSLLNSIAIRVLVFLASIFFLLGLVLLNRWKFILEFMALFFLTFLFWLIVWRPVLDSFAYIYYCFASLSFVFGGIVLYQSEDVNLIRKLFFILTLVYFITAFTTIIGLSKYPLAVREMGRGSTYDTRLDFEVYKTIYRSMNIAGWGQIYGMLFVIPSCMMLWKRIKRPFYLFLLAVVELSIIFSQLTFATVLSFVFIFGMCVIGEKKIKSILVSLFSLLIISLALINLEACLTWVINIFDEYRLDFLTNKLNDLKHLLLYKQAVGNVSSRGEVYRISIESFFQSPVVGQLLNNNVTQNDIGRHSDFWDILGALGLVGISGIYFAVVGYFRFIRKIGSDFRKELIVIYLGFLILFILNPVISSPPIFISVFLYSILSIKMCLKKV